MPHLIFSVPIEIPYPYCEGDYTFLECFFSESHNALMLVRYKDIYFFLTIQKKDRKFFVKIDKKTRVVPVGIAKKALEICKNFYKDFLLHDNLSKNTLKQQNESPYLISADTFYTYIPDQKTCILEIGFGSGRKILNDASNHKDTFFFGIETHTPSIEQVLRQITLKKLKNVYIIKGDARLIIQSLPYNTLFDKIIVHFPIPWDKQHRWVINEHFITHAQQIIKDSGYLHLRTDDFLYLTESLKSMMYLAQGYWEVFKNKPEDTISKYETRWIKQHKDIYDIFWYPQGAREDNEYKNYNFNFLPHEAKKLYERFSCEHFMPIKKMTDSVLLSAKALYRSKNGSLVIALCMGNKYYPQNTYLIIIHDEEFRAFYCPALLATSYQAHCMLKSLEENI